MWVTAFLAGLLFGLGFGVVIMTEGNHAKPKSVRKKESKSKDKVGLKAGTTVCDNCNGVRRTNIKKEVQTRIKKTTNSVGKVVRSSRKNTTRSRKIVIKGRKSRLIKKAGK